MNKYFYTKEFDRAVKVLLFGLTALVAYDLAVYLFFDIANLLLINILSVLALIFIQWPRGGLYLLAFLLPFWGLVYRAGQVELPIYDLVGLALLLALTGKTLAELATGKKSWAEVGRDWPAVIFFGLFVLVSSWSIMNNEYWRVGLKYLLRPLVFMYLVNVIVPGQLIKSWQVFKTTLIVLLTSTLITAGLSLIGAFSGGGSWILRRLEVITVFGVDFFAGNHNAVAEVMIVGVPVAIFLYFINKNYRLQNGLILLVLLLSFVLAITFSRTGWLALAVELGLIFYFIFYKYVGSVQKYKLFTVLIVILAILGFFYAAIWGGFSDIEGSDSSRWLMTGIAYNRFLDHPFVGNGLNTFSGLVGGTFAYAVEFGDPLDSHGFVQKILTENGILGFGAFVALLGMLLWSLIKSYQKISSEKDKQLVIVLITLFVGVVFFQLFSTSYFNAKMWLPIGLAMAGVRLIERGKSEILNSKF